MTTKTKNIINWTLTGLVAFIFIGTAIGKLTGKLDGKALGLDPGTFKVIAIVELLCAILFIIPRTGLLGTLLLAAYMGGTIATLLEHGQSIIPAVIIQVIVWIVAVARFPELKQRLLNKKTNRS